ncbi:Nramp family divalent metal transporter [Cellulomonas sp. SLBN-39]|uniref:Nramp family divalent metal transporter n=1 Tax=Cellulomonas sp. SLBN-39 TaxID=2768446 RepID=UPI001150223B|nr:Nramp family divalent metal transporter [Cellulomonas sp. SLBN-39]TQL02560.1 manganese transport protein [Cellulomonas sp. SLBN-39]
MRDNGSPVGVADGTTDAPRRGPHGRPAGRIPVLLGPAFVAAVAYVDPGNVAANLTAGARYGYLLLWVLVAANAMAVLVQYQSAKLGLVTGRSLPEILGDRLGRRSRLAFWAQAELVAAATDVAEVVGGAIALHLLFGVPLPLGGVIVGAASLLLLATQDRYGQRRFEAVVVALLLVITVGFLAGLVLSPPDAGGVLAGLAPRFDGSDSVLLAASMLGATVMPHAIYVHSALVRDRHGRAPEGEGRRLLLRATRWDVATALAVAGAVNIGLLLLAASALQGVEGTDSIEGAHAAIVASLGPAIGVVFAVGLLASGLASTSVGAYAGATIMAGLLHRRIPLLVRRVVTIVPAVVLLALGADPTWTLVLSQVVLSFGIPFVMVPLVRLTRDRSVMGADRSGPVVHGVLCVVVALVVALNLALLGLLVVG